MSGVGQSISRVDFQVPLARMDSEKPIDTVSGLEDHSPVVNKLAV